MEIDWETNGIPITLTKPPELTARSVLDFQLPPAGHDSILLGDRWLSRGDIAILASTSSMGKSSASLQMAFSWALGRDFIGGLKPNRPLKSLIFQSEDGEGDVAEVKYSLIHAMKLTDEEQIQIGVKVKIVTDRIHRGLTFIAELKRQIAVHKPDIIFINPLLAFIGGDVNDAKDAGSFIRDGLNGLNEPATHAYIIIHHTAKPPKEKTDRKWNEVMYEMAGSADLTNAARAIISLRSTDKEGEFDLVLAKRGRRAGYTKKVKGKINPLLTFDEPTMSVPIKWSKDRMTVPGHKEMPVIFWERRAEDEKPEVDSRGAKEKYPFSVFRSAFPAKDQPAKKLNEIHRIVNQNCPISTKQFYNVLQRYAELGHIEVVDSPNATKGYRLAL